MTLASSTVGLLVFLMTAQASGATVELRERIELHTHSPAAVGALVGADRPERLEQVSLFYVERGFEPALVNAQAAAELLVLLHGAASEGLEPDEYGAARIATTLQAAHGGDAHQLAAADVMLVHALLRYAGAVAHGRLSPRAVGWRTEPRSIDLGSVLREVVATNSLAPLRTLVPSWPEYDALKSALAALRRIEAAGGWPELPDGPPIEEGATDARVPILAERLRIGGELEVAGTGEPEIYDQSLREAVQRFQRRHGLVADGVVGKGTRRALNVPVAKRIAQLEVNLERWRWMPAQPEGRHCLVNAAGGELVILEGGEPVLRSRIVSGRPDWATPVLSDQIVELHVNPRWYVPRSITVDEVLEILQRNPAWAVGRGMRVRGADGEYLDPRDIDWSAVDAENLPYRLVQEPGPANPLGRYKFVLTNRMAIYLHGTPSTALFELPQRHFSHGCIRVEQADALAELLASDQHREPLDRARKSGDTEKIALDQPLPVFLLYFTAWVDEHGTLQLRDDVYGRDRRTLKRLEACAKDPRGKGCR